MLFRSGAFWCGGDPRAPRSLPGRQIWLDAFIIKRYPVTCQEYCDFLNDLVRSGRAQQAERAWTGDQLLPRAAGADGTYQVGPDPEKHPVDPSQPVSLVNYFGAAMYACWLAHQTGLRWTIPGELALEKAARGVDGRAFPWGDAFDPTWCNMSESSPMPGPIPVREVRSDTSPWGVCGMAGNVAWWSADVYRALGPPVPLALPREGAEGVDEDIRMVVKGGAYTSVEHLCRGATRLTYMSQHASPALGFGIARLPPEPVRPVMVR